MREVTYPNESVISMIAENFVPLMLQCNFAKPTELMKKYHVRWTPTLLALDVDGKPRYHTVGFMPPDELIAHLALIGAMANFDGGKFGDAITRLRAIVQKHPQSSAAAQAIFYEGVAGYKKSHDAKKLKQAYLELKEKYPESLWAKKAIPYADIPG
jgi:thioredoxin-related protein